MKYYPKVNYLIPTFNRSDELIKAIEGALSQDYNKLEVIVSDDASNDKTQKVVEKYLNNKRFKYYRNQKNLGPYKNFKKLIYEYNNSDWFILQSDDDYLTDKSYISKCISLLIKYENYDISLIGANLEVVYENSNIKINTQRHYPEIKDGKWYFLNFAKPHYNFCFPFVLQNTNIVKKLGCWTSEFPDEGSLVGLMLFLNGHVIFLEDTVGVFKVYDVSTPSFMTNFNSNIFIIDLMKNLSEIDKIYNYCLEMRIFPHKVIEKWRKKMILKYVDQNVFYLIKYNEKNKALLLNKLLLLKKEIKTKYPFVNFKEIKIKIFILLAMDKSLFLKKLIKKLYILFKLYKLNI